jgi:hypothetical protein
VEICRLLLLGLGKDFLARKAAESIGADRVVDLAELLPAEAVLAILQWELRLWLPLKF